MKVYQLNRNSWHYKLARYGADGGPSDNFCYYFREVMWAFFKIFLHALWISILVLCTGVATVAYFSHGVLPWEVSHRGLHLISLVFMVEAILLIGGLLLFCAVNLDDWQKAKRMARWEAARSETANRDFYHEHGYWPWQAPTPPKEPGFFKLWYKTFKEKTCVKLVFK